MKRPRTVALRLHAHLQRHHHQRTFLPIGRRRGSGIVEAWQRAIGSAIAIAGDQVSHGNPFFGAGGQVGRGQQANRSICRGRRRFAPEGLRFRPALQRGLRPSADRFRETISTASRANARWTIAPVEKRARLTFVSASLYHHELEAIQGKQDACPVGLTRRLRDVQRTGC